MDKNKFNKLRKDLGKYLIARLNITGDKGLNRDLKTVLSCVNLTPEGAIIVDYGYMEGQGLDVEKISPIINQFFKDNGLKGPKEQEM